MFDLEVSDDCLVCSVDEQSCLFVVSLFGFKFGGWWVVGVDDVGQTVSCDVVGLAFGEA